MLYIILYILIIVSFVGLIVVIIKKVPVLVDLSDDEIAILVNKKGYIHKFSEINFRHHFSNLIVKLEKFLRKVKIIFLKIENLLSKLIKWLSSQSAVMTHKSREWIKHKEAKRLKNKQKIFSKIKRNSKPITPDDIQVVGNVFEKKDDVIEKSSVGSAKSEEIEVDMDIEEDIVTNQEKTYKPRFEKDPLPLSELGKPTKEEQKLINLIVENPKNITAYKLLGFLYWKQHNYVDAKSSLEMAVKLGSCDKKVNDTIFKLREMAIEDDSDDIL